MADDSTVIMSWNSDMFSNLIGVPDAMTNLEKFIQMLTQRCFLTIPTFF